MPKDQDSLQNQHGCLEEEIRGIISAFGTIRDQSCSRQPGNHHPVVYAQCVSGWKACDAWKDTSYVVSRVERETEVDVVMAQSSTSSLRVVRPYGASLETRHMSVEDFFHHRGNDMYIAQEPLLLIDKKDGSIQKGSLYNIIAEDVSLEPLIEHGALPQCGCDMVSVNLWCSAAGGTRMLSSLHYDCHENVLCVVRGKKVVRCAPFEAVPLECLRHEHPFEWGYGNHTASYTLFPEYEANLVIPGGEGNDFPSGSKYQEFELEAGDALYIPQGFWHHVCSDGSESDGITMAVNFWWNEDPLISSSRHYVDCIEYNSCIAQHGWMLLDRRVQDLKAMVPCDTVECVLHCIQNGDTETLVTTTEECRLESTNGSQIVELIIGSLYSHRSPELFHAYVAALSPRTMYNIWNYCSPTCVEYLTTGFAEVCTSDASACDAGFQHMYGCFSPGSKELMEILQNKKQQFKSMLFQDYDKYVK